MLQQPQNFKQTGVVKLTGGRTQNTATLTQEFDFTLIRFL